MPEYICICIVMSSSTSRHSNIMLSIYRCYGDHTSLLIDREKELEVVRAAAEQKFGPPVFGTFENGYCYGYVHVMI